MSKWISPTGVLNVIDRYGAITHYFCAEEMNAVDEESGDVDWSILRDLCWDQYHSMCGYPFVKSGWFEVDKPMREGRAMFVGMFPTEIAERAKETAKCGLYCCEKTGEPNLDETLLNYRAELKREILTEDTRRQFNQYIDVWKTMFPDDERVIDFEVEFTLNMIERQRVIVRDSRGRGRQSVVYQLVSKKPKSAWPVV